MTPLGRAGRRLAAPGGVRLRGARRAGELIGDAAAVGQTPAAAGHRHTSSTVDDLNKRPDSGIMWILGTRGAPNETR